MARRFDPHIGRYLDHLTGAIHEPQQLYRPPDKFTSYIELPAEVDDIEPLAFVLRRLLLELVQHAIARDLGVQQFRIVLQHAMDHATEQTIGLLRPERDAEKMLELAMSRLERVTLPAPVRGVTLQCHRLLLWQPQKRDLLDNSTDAEAVQLLFERLRARLGENAVRGFGLTGDPRPERAWRFAKPGQPAGAESNVQRPVLLLAQPRPIGADDFTLLSGPERIEAGWWDGADVARDYYIACLRSRRSLVGIPRSPQHNPLVPTRLVCLVLIALTQRRTTLLQTRVERVEITVHQHRISAHLVIPKALLIFDIPEHVTVKLQIDLRALRRITVVTAHLLFTAPLMDAPIGSTLKNVVDKADAAAAARRNRKTIPVTRQGVVDHDDFLIAITQAANRQRVAAGATNIAPLHIRRTTVVATKPDDDVVFNDTLGVGFQLRPGTTGQPTIGNAEAPAHTLAI